MHLILTKFHALEKHLTKTFKTVKYNFRNS